MITENSQQDNQTLLGVIRFERRHRLTVSKPLKDIEMLLDRVCRYIVESRGGRYTQFEDITRISTWLCQKRRFGLLLIGSVGTGKTTIARAVKNLINHLQIGKVRYKEGEDTFTGFVSHGEWQEDSNGFVEEISAIELCRLASGDHEEYERVKKCAALVLDDLGNEPTTVKNYGNEQSPVAELIDWRNDHQLLTIATSNLSTRTKEGKNQFFERYGDRTASRMSELFDVIVIKGQDHRKGDK